MHRSNNTQLISLSTRLENRHRVSLAGSVARQYMKPHSSKGAGRPGSLLATSGATRNWSVVYFSFWSYAFFKSSSGSWSLLYESAKPYPSLRSHFKPVEVGPVQSKRLYLSKNTSSFAHQTSPITRAAPRLLGPSGVRTVTASRSLGLDALRDTPVTVPTIWRMFLYPPPRTRRRRHVSSPARLA